MDVAAILAGLFSMVWVVASAPTTADMVYAVQRHFRSGCIFLWKEDVMDFHSIKKLQQTQRQLAEKRLLTASVNTSSFGKVSCRHNRPLVVLISDSSIRTARSQVIMAQTKADYILLTEVYRVAHEKPLQQAHFGLWNTEVGLEAVKGGLYTRRRDLQGLQIKSAMFTNRPFIKVINKTGLIKAGGYFGRIWDELERHLNFTTKYFGSAENVWGQKLSNGSWTGVIGMLTEGQIDVSNSAFIMNHQRMQAVDFIMPPIYLNFRIVIRTPDDYLVRWTNFMEPFESLLWACVLSTILILIVVNYFSLTREREQNRKATLFDSAMQVFSAVLCIQGRSHPPQSLSARIVFLTQYVMVIVLFNAYSASFVSILTVDRVEMPFTNLQGMLEDGSYELGVPRASSLYNMMHNAEEGLLKDLYQQLMSHNLEDYPRQTQPALIRVCEKKYAFITVSEAVIAFAKSAPCAYTFIPEVFSKGAVSMVLSKGSPYLGLFNYNMQKLLEKGVLRYIHLETVPQSLPNTESNPSSIDFKRIVPEVCILAASVFLAVLALAIERARDSGK